MDKKIYGKENYVISKWSGGTTCEIAIYPESAVYLDRDFIWRLSSAGSDLEESSFTKLPDFDRILMLLDGDVVLAHGEERVSKLGKFDQDTFDGAFKTKCFGKLKKDYNLIYRKGSTARMELIELTDAAEHLKLREGLRVSCGIYCVDGYTVVSADGETSMLKADEQMVINCDESETVAVSVMGQGKCIFTEVAFEKEKMIAFEPAAAKADGTSNFLTAMRLSLSNNRWSNVVSKAKKKGFLYTPALTKKLRVLDKYFVTGIVWAAGVIACLTLLLAGLSSEAVFLLILAFTAVDFLLISPLIYLAVLPKPLSAHIKKSEDLNIYERKLFEEQLSYDPRHENLMYKYRDRTGEEYESMKDFLRKLNK